MPDTAPACFFAVLVSMEFDYSTRIKVAITFLLTVLLAGNLRQLKDAATFDFSFIGKDPISLYEKRFEALRKALPAHGVVTYTDDCNGEREVFKAYFLTQYALSPIVLFHPKFPPTYYSQEMVAHEHHFVISNSHDPIREPYLTRLLPSQFAVNGSPLYGIKQEITANDGFVLLQDSGYGAKLYRTAIR
jgi:hypothetical protein